MSHKEQKDIEKALRLSLLEAAPQSLKSKKESPRVTKNSSTPPAAGAQNIAPRDTSTHTTGSHEKYATGSKVKSKLRVTKYSNAAAADPPQQSKPSLRPSSGYVPPPPLELMKEDVFVLFSDDDETSSSTSDADFTLSSNLAQKKKKETDINTSKGINQNQLKRKSDFKYTPAAKKSAYNTIPPSIIDLSSDDDDDEEEEEEEEEEVKHKKKAVASVSPLAKKDALKKKAPLTYVIEKTPNKEKILYHKTSLKTPPPGQGQKTSSPVDMKSKVKTPPGLARATSSKSPQIKNKIYPWSTPPPSHSKKFRKTPPPPAVAKKSAAVAKKMAYTLTSKTPTFKKTSTEKTKTPMPKAKKATAKKKALDKKAPAAETSPPPVLTSAEPETPKPEEPQMRTQESSNTSLERSPLKWVAPIITIIITIIIVTSMYGFQAQRKFPVNITPTKPM